ncbi:hypothetical protein GCM10023196_054170 [Actinoallomurus vinaceus]|uniref:Uncharacterized protein n=1 Tax=Actinoallomurus vinaceus TaxID=1080074 RepID=A0ABP8UHP6_9ACTN
MRSESVVGASLLECDETLKAERSEHGVEGLRVCEVGLVLGFGTAVSVYGWFFVRQDRTT